MSGNTMGFLHKLIRKIASKKQLTPPAPKPKKSLEEIWLLEDPSDLIGELDVYIAIKCEYGEYLSVLSPQEKVFYITQILEMEVNNGGFDQFFFNSSGDLANEVVRAFLEIGAVKTAEICKKAISIFGAEVPTNRDERQDFLDEHEELEEILGECDDAFFAYEEDLDALNYAYVINNKPSFR